MNGILFKPEMIKAIAEGRKTVTRRMDGLREINQVPNKWEDKDGWQFKCVGGSWYATGKHGYHCAVKPRYQVGEVVYIKEPWHYLNIEENKATPYDFGIEFADGEILWWTDNGNEMNYPLDEKKRSPMFLKAKFARYFIKITDVRPERLQEITEEDTIKEGIVPSRQRYFRPSNVEQYAALWDSINPKRPWSSNPWVWRIEFKKVEKL